MASGLSLRHLLRGAAAPRIGTGFHLRGFTAASNAGGQRPAVPPMAARPPPGPPVLPAKPAGAPAPPFSGQPAATTKPPPSPAAPAKPAASPAPAKPTRSSAPAASKAASSTPGTPSGRDPERPKRPASAWLRYLADFRKQSQSLKGAEVMTAAAAKWRDLSAEKRKPYETPYEAEKKVYDKAFAEYVASGKRDAWIRDPEKPKKPLTAFFRFAGEYRVKHPSLKITEATKNAGALWKSMTTGPKAPYEQKYASEKAEYDKLIKEYKDSGKEAAYKAKKGPTAAEEKKAKELAKKEKEAASKLKLKASVAKRKEKEAASKLKLKAAAAKRKEREAAKKLKLKAIEAAKKEKEAAKKLKAKEAAVRQKVKDAATKMKAKAVAAAVKLAKAKPAAREARAM